MTKTSPISLAAAAPRMIISVDTEEQFDWSEEMSPDAHLVADPADIDQFQKLCADYGAAPIYFLTYPVMMDDASSTYFRTLTERHQAVTGLHLHQWNTPPESDHRGEYYSFQSNLPDVIYRAKIKALAAAHEARIGQVARAHRAGRYGISLRDYEFLSAEGIEFDFSPSAAFDFSACGGPDFSTLSNQPFAVTPTDGRKIIVTPVSGARAAPRTTFFLSQNGAAPGFSANGLSMLKSHCAPMRLTPEGADFAHMKALTQRLLKDETPVLTFTIHSTTLTPGSTQYAKTQGDVDDVLALTRQYFDYYTKTLGGKILSFAELERVYANAAGRV